jgi:hypothetical protein
MTVAAAVGMLPRRMAGWAARRSLAPNALTGIGMACSLSAAVWFTAGTRSATIAGALALCAGYLPRRVAAQLAVAREAGQAVRGGVAGMLAEPVLAEPVLAEPALAAGAGFDGWLTGVGGATGELAVYAGLAVGAGASERHGIWMLATEAAIMLSIGQVARLCQPRGAGRQPARPALLLLAKWLLTLPAGGRTAVIAVTAPLWGPRVSFQVLIVWGAVAALWAVAQGSWTASRQSVSDQSVSDQSAGGWPGSGVPAPGDMIAACRDDGPVARLAGRIVHGQLVPLPPALAGLAATVLLAGLGLGNLPGILVLAPVAAMLLAAPGAGHPHDGPLDWLVPLVLQAGVCIYLAALGFSAGVPGPVTFGLTSAVALRQLDVACRAREPARWPAQRSGLGWDGRIFVLGLSALLGIVTFAYLALTAYLGWLLCRVSLSGWLAVRKPDISEPVISEPVISEGERR